MKTAAILAALAIVAFVAAPASAYVILLVSDANAPDEPGGDHNDDSFVAWLDALPGIDVDTHGMTKRMRGDLGADDLAAIAACDMIIVSRRTDSGAYNKPQQWNPIEKPLLLCSGYLTRSSRWGWTTGGSGNVGNTETDMAIIAGKEGHDFYTKENAVTAPVTLFDWSTSPTGKCPKQVYLPPMADVKDAGNTLLGTMDVDPNTIRAMMMDFPKGFDFDQGGDLKYGAAGGNRAFFAHWGYDDPPTGTNGPGGTPSEWEDYITADYENILENIVMTKIPEPATLALLGLGGCMVLIRRRKRA